jgi:hypothetical protein
MTKVSRGEMGPYERILNGKTGKREIIDAAVHSPYFVLSIKYVLKIQQ